MTYKNVVHAMTCSVWSESAVCLSICSKRR